MATELEPKRHRERRRLRGWTDPFERIHEDMDRVFSEHMPRVSFPRLGFGSHADGDLLANLDLSETDDSVEVVMDAPGLEDKDLDIKLSDGALTIKGKRESEKEEKKKNYHRVERSYGEFQRRITLPCEVEPDRIEALLSKGVLTVTLPKTPKAKEHERKIEVHTTA